MCHISGKVKNENFTPESIVPNIVKNFFHVEKNSHYMFSPFETFHNGLGKPGRDDRSSVDLFCLKPD